MKWSTATIVEKKVWSEGLFTLVVEGAEVQQFEAGQFLQLGLQLPDRFWNRPYSVASPFGERLDFFIVEVEDGKLTPMLWKLDLGDQLEVSTRAAGSFTLSKCPQAETLWLIATGTGLAPYVAMLRTEKPWETYDRIVVVHGTRHQRELAYQEEFRSYRQRFKGRFEYVSVVSREQPEAGLSGRITTCLANGSLEKQVDTPFNQDCCVMLCGNPAMLDETEQMLIDRGLSRHSTKNPGNIVVERYW